MVMILMVEVQPMELRIETFRVLPIFRVASI